MKFWVYTLILCSVLTALIRIFLPKGEKSPLYSPLKFLLSLVLIVSVFSPFFNFFKKDWSSVSTLQWDFSEYQNDSEKILLEKCIERINLAVHSAWPEAEFSLEVTANENYVPTGIRVRCANEELGLKIARFLQTNYSLIAGYEGTVE